MRLEIELVTDRRCAATGCTGCYHAERVVREFAEERGIPLPPSEGAPEAPIEAGLGSRGAVVLRHLGCDEAGALPKKARLPLVRINGELVLSGPSWDLLDLRRAVRSHLRGARPTLEP